MVGEALPFVHDVARVLGFVAGGVVVAEVAGGVYQGRDFLCSRFVDVYVEWNFFQRHAEVDVYEGTVGVFSRADRYERPFLLGGFALKLL